MRIMPLLSAQKKVLAQEASDQLEITELPISKDSQHIFTQNNPEQYFEEIFKR